MAVGEIKINVRTDITNQYINKLKGYAPELIELMILQQTALAVAGRTYTSKILSPEDEIFKLAYRLEQVLAEIIEDVKEELNTDEQESKCEPTAEPVQEQDVKEPGAFPINAADVDGYFG